MVAGEDLMSSYRETSRYADDAATVGCRNRSCSAAAGRCSRLGRVRAYNGDRGDSVLGREAMRGRQCGSEFVDHRFLVSLAREGRRFVAGSRDGRCRNEK